MSTGVYTSATQILTKSYEVLQKVIDILADATATDATRLQAKKTLFEGLIGSQSSIRRLA